MGLTEFDNNYFTESCSGSEAGSNLRPMDFEYHPTPGLGVIKKKKKKKKSAGVPPYKKMSTPLGPPYPVRDLVESSHVVEALEASL